jgi:hypothetical protein
MLCWDHVILYVVLTKKEKTNALFVSKKERKRPAHFDMYLVVYSIKYIYVLLFVLG